GLVPVPVLGAEIGRPRMTRHRLGLRHRQQPAPGIADKGSIVTADEDVGGPQAAMYQAGLMQRGHGLQYLGEAVPEALAIFQVVQRRPSMRFLALAAASRGLAIREHS